MGSTAESISELSESARLLLEQAWHCQQTQQFHMADTLYAQALADALPPVAQQFALQQRGLLALIAHQATTAEVFLRKALALGESADLLNLLASALRAQGQIASAHECLERALKLDPENAACWHNLANLCRQETRWQEALNCLQEAYRLNPRLPHLETTLLNLIKHLLSIQKMEVLWPLLALPNYNLAAPLYFIRGVLHQLLGQPEQAWHEHQRACQLRPGQPDYQTGLHTLAFFLPELSDAERFAPFQQWGQDLEAHTPLQTGWRLPDPERKLRIGYISGDFKAHSLSFMLLGLVQTHQHKDFFWIGYTNSPADDEFTQRFQKCFDLWRPVHHLTDEELAARIEADKVDILVDLSGHTQGHRLEVFARKPAPLQISGLGFGWTTGLTRMDYCFSDPWIVPPERQSLYTETIYYLPHLFNWWPSESIFQLPLQPLPCLEQPLTLGCGNQGFKLNQTLISTWAEILKALPQARLALKFKGLEDPFQAQHLRRRFEALGIAQERLLLSGKSSHREHVAWYSQLDLALDPFPYQGGISTLEALWMGVPVIAMTGGTRASVSILHTLGLPELLASHWEEYISKTLELAQDRLRLLHYRQSLRQTLLNSPICDHLSYVRTLEAAYRTLWRKWCATQSS